MSDVVNRSAEGAIPPPRATTHLLTIEDAARYLNVPKNWVQDKVTERAIPHTRLGKHVRFTPDHLATIIADGQQPLETTRKQQANARTRL